MRGDRRVDGSADADQAVGDVTPALSQQSFSIASPKALTDGKADEGSIDAEGVFTSSGTFGTENPAGTGPFKFESWVRNERLTLTRYDDYWGDKAKIDELIIRPIADNAARLQALQTGEIQGYDLVEPQDIATIEGDEALQIIDRPAFNVAYVGFNIAKKPTDDPKVREAISRTASTARRSWTTSTPAGASSRRSSCRRRSSVPPTTSRRTSTTRRRRSRSSPTPATRSRSHSSSGTRRTSRVRTCRIRSGTSKRSPPA